MRNEYLGMKLSKQENKALIYMARHEGVPKSLYARQILRAHLLEKGVLVHNPAPQVEEITVTL